ncbi:MAG: DUF3035 domain-containing protein [Alphaproteobacteria bacterium]|nr:DUF3035 domain-containing protein [Alphaproteobacteria bacterium]NCQ88810.1 DUF3035 domain-containing protein [Alphaproteobacteria bacterium]NCT07267.1 DUF3035 domain-containing protein [Alphaproteobacteria bacterium]
MTYKTAFLALIALPISFALIGCESTKEQFDFSKKAPDEFAIVKRAPLEMPPNFNLRPPRPGQARPQEDSAVDEAKQAIFGEEGVSVAQTEAAPVSEGESILLQKSGVDLTAPNIRDVIDAETQQLNKENKPTIDRILGVTGKKYEAPSSVVNARAESERIQTNIEQGKSVSDGATPTVKK